MRLIQFIGGWMPLSVVLLVTVILTRKEIHGAPFEVPARRERLSRGDRNKLGGGNEPGRKEKNENGRWGGGLLSRGRPKERRIHDEFPEDFDYWQRLESHDRSKRDDTHCNIGDSDSRKLPYLHSNMKVSPLGALLFTALGAISGTLWYKTRNNCIEEFRWDDHRVQLQLLEDKLQALEGDKGRLEKVIRERSVEAEARESEIETLRKEIHEAEKLRKEADKYCTEVDTLRTEASESEKLRKEIDSHRSEIDTLRTEASEAENLRKEIDSYRSEAGEAENLRKEIDTYRTEVDTLRTEASEAENLRKEVDKYCTEVDTLRTETGKAENLRKEIDTYRTEVDTLRTEASEAENLRKEIDSYCTETDTLRKEVNDLKMDIEVLSLAKESAEELASVVAEEVSGLRNRLEEDNSRKAVWVGSAAFAELKVEKEKNIRSKFKVMGLNRAVDLEQYISELKTEILNLGNRLVFEREQAVKDEQSVRFEKEKEYETEILKLTQQRDRAIETERARLQQQIEELTKRLEGVKDLVRRKLHEKRGGGKEDSAAATATGVFASTLLKRDIASRYIAGMQ